MYPDGDYKLEEVEKPSIGANPYAPYDVLIEIQYCGVCGSDIHQWGVEEKSNLYSSSKPVIGGHEVVGVVKEVGEKVTRFKPGDGVVCEIVTFYCDDCINCRTGHYNVCANMDVMDQRVHYRTGGGFAEYGIWPERHLHRLPESISYKEAVLMETTAGASHSVLEKMKVEVGETVVILGPGARGIILLQIAKAAGADPVIITGLERDTKKRLKLAEEMGADYTINSSRTDLAQFIKEKTYGQGADVVIENTGSPKAVEETFDLVRSRGRILISGGGIRGGITAHLDTRKLIVKELEVHGEISHVWTSWKKALHLVEKSKVDLKPLVTSVYSLEDWKEAFDRAAFSEDEIRVAIKPN